MGILRRCTSRLTSPQIEIRKKKLNSPFLRRIKCRKLLVSFETSYQDLPKPISSHVILKLHFLLLFNLVMEIIVTLHKEKQKKRPSGVSIRRMCHLAHRHFFLGKPPSISKKACLCVTPHFFFSCRMLCSLSIPALIRKR